MESPADPNLGPPIFDLGPIFGSGSKGDSRHLALEPLLLNHSVAQFGSGDHLWLNMGTWTLKQPIKKGCHTIFLGQEGKFQGPGILKGKKKVNPDFEQRSSQTLGSWRSASLLRKFPGTDRNISSSDIFF